MKILIVDDDSSFSCILEKMLIRWGYEVCIARDGNEACLILQSDNAPKLALLDWKMPGMDGVELCQKIRKHTNGYYSYIIFLTSQQRDEDIIIGMQAGADDYIIKPFKHEELRVRLQAGTRILELQDELFLVSDILRHKASQDSLTGLWNHEEILDKLNREMARSEREKESVSIIMVDIDHFKAINDTYGHVSGDEVLLKVAQMMHSMMRTYDSIGRYGGDEFLIILPKCSMESAVSFAERICSRINTESLDLHGGRISVSVSLGVATSNPDKLCDGGFLVRSADAALYNAKNNGRNRVELTPCEPGEIKRKQSSYSSSHAGNKSESG